MQAQTVHLAQVQARRQRATAAVLDERDTVAQLKVSIVNRKLAVQRARSLRHEPADPAAPAAHARGADPRPAGRPGADAAIRAARWRRRRAAPTLRSCAHGGPYGFFQAAGTNYSVNQEPIIAARLDQLGKALQLHLIGVSGYRTPQHSVEVGGFADDPHTRGMASDTPGVEGVPESTLEQFCLTRPFPGAHEADHIQEAGTAVGRRFRAASQSSGLWTAAPSTASPRETAAALPTGRSRGCSRTSRAARSPERTAPSM